MMGVQPELPSDRDTLRWACREAIPCAVILPGQRFWGRSFHVDLREGAPRPHLAVAQPIDLRDGRARALRAGDSVRLWSVRDGRPWHLDGFVSSIGVVEGRGCGPVEAAVVQLPYRLLDTERRLRRAEDRRERLRIELTAEGPTGPGTPATLVETWIGGGGGWLQRGDGHVAELSRRTLTFSVPLASPIALLAGAAIELAVELPDLDLQTRVIARVVAVMEWGEQVLYGLALGQPADDVSADEHRETLRRAAPVAT
jgi:hypothetical protein